MSSGIFRLDQHAADPALEEAGRYRGCGLPFSFAAFIFQELKREADVTVALIERHALTARTRREMRVRSEAVQQVINRFELDRETE